MNKSSYHCCTYRGLGCCRCKKQMEKGTCKARQCLFPTPCKNMVADHREYIDILKSLRTLDGVKKVFVRSGVRFDYVLADRDSNFLRELVRHHVSGQLKVAPEHVSPNVLRYMGKPDVKVYDAFVDKYKKENEKADLKQYLVPYFMSSHPGCTLDDAILLAEYMKRTGQHPDQVQDFYPTPGTLSTAMFFTGIDPRDMKSVYVPRDPEEKAMQRALMQYNRPQNRAMVEKALIKAGRRDLIGFGKDCLIPPRDIRRTEKTDVGTKKGEGYKKSGNRPSGKTTNASTGRKGHDTDDKIQRKHDVHNGRSGRKTDRSAGPRGRKR